MIDWNVIQSHTNAGSLPASGQLVLSDQAFHEIVGKDDEESRGSYLAKLPRYFQGQVARVWMGMNWVCLLSASRKEARKLGALDMLHREYTGVLRRALTDPAIEWRSLWRDAMNGRAYEIGRESKEWFMGLVGALDKWQTATGATRPSNDEEARAITEDSGEVRTCVKAFMGKWRVPSQDARISASVDSLPVSRFARILMWYLLSRMCGARQKFENNADDAHYLLLASYTGHLATHDKALRNAARNLFPNMRLWPACN